MTILLEAFAVLFKLALASFVVFVCTLVAANLRPGPTVSPLNMASNGVWQPVVAKVDRNMVLFAETASTAGLCTSTIGLRIACDLLPLAARSVSS